MENPRGTVLSVVGDGPERYAIVEVSPQFRCARCEAGKGCGAGLLGNKRRPRRTEVLIGPTLQVCAGDAVEIELAPRNLLRGAVLVYGLPLAGAVIAAALAWLSGLGDAAAAIAALGGIGAGMLVARRLLRQPACLDELTPSIAVCTPRQEA